MRVRVDALIRFWRKLWRSCIVCREEKATGYTPNEVARYTRQSDLGGYW